MTDPADVAAEASSLSAGYGILTVQLFPFALPLLLLCIAPLLPLVVVGLLLAAILYLPLKIIRYFTRRRRSVRDAVTQGTGAHLSTSKPAQSHR